MQNDEYIRYFVWLYILYIHIHIFIHWKASENFMNIANKVPAKELVVERTTFMF